MEITNEIYNNNNHNNKKLKKGGRANEKKPN